MVVNAIGSRWNSGLTGDNKIDWQAKAFKGDNFWSIELSIPFTALGNIPKNNNIWRGNICRNIYTTGERFSSWANLETEFHIPEKFAKIIFRERTLFSLAAQRISAEISDRLLQDTILRNLDRVAHTAKMQMIKSMENNTLLEKIAMLNKERIQIKKQLRNYTQFSLTEQNRLLEKSYQLVQEADDIEIEILLASI